MGKEETNVKATKKRGGINLGMMAVSSDSLLVPNATGDKANNEYVEKKYGRKTRAKINNILEFADMQTREMFDPVKNEADAIFAQSIKEHGIIQDIGLVSMGDPRDKKYKLIFGHRRFQAAKHVGIKEISAILYPADIAPQIIDLHTLIENFHRSQLTVLEEARVVGMYSEKYELTVREMALRLGIHRSQVNRLQIIDRAAEPTKKFIKKHNLASYNAYKIASAPDKDRQNIMDAIDQGVIATSAIGLKGVNRKRKVLNQSDGGLPVEQINYLDKLISSAEFNESVAKMGLENKKEEYKILFALLKEKADMGWDKAEKRFNAIPSPIREDTVKAIKAVLVLKNYFRLADQCTVERSLLVIKKLIDVR